MPYILRFWFALALSLALMAGCSDENGEGGSGGMAGTGGTAGTGGSDLCTGVNCDDQDLCTVDACDTATGACSYAASCDDGNDCTVDMCDPADGMCSHNPSEAFTPCGEEQDLGICDDEGSCAFTSCEGREEGIACASGSMSGVGFGVCKDGECFIPNCDIDADCELLNQCTVGTCSEINNMCEYTWVEDGTACDDGVVGPLGAVCRSGYCRDLECEDAADCNDFNECTTAQCISFGFCGEPLPVSDGTPCAGGQCSAGKCSLSDAVLPCTEQGIRNAIAAGSGPYTFDCDGPTTVVTEDGIVIDNDVILDGEGSLTVDGNNDHTVFRVSDVTVELRHFEIRNGMGQVGGIDSYGTLTLVGMNVSENTGDGVAGILISRGTLTLVDSTVSGNMARLGGNAGGIYAGGDALLINSTVSNNTVPVPGGGISTFAALTLINSTVSGNLADNGSAILAGANNATTLINSTVIGDIYAGELVAGPFPTVSITTTASVINGECSEGFAVVTWTSLGHNIESPGDTCGFDQDSDQVNVTAEQLNLGPLQDNGGPTETHALLPGSVAIDAIPAEDCVDADDQPLTTDQRGEPRPVAILGAEPKCDVGAFEVQP